MMTDEIRSLTEQLDPGRLPAHVAIIMDGNGRWARQRHRPRLYGHRAGAKAVRQVVEIAGELHLPHLTLYAFSTENWSRPRDEISGLFSLLIEYLKKETDELNRKNVVLRLIGSPAQLKPEFLKRIHDLTRKTWNNTGLHLNVLFNYGGRQEITDAVRQIAEEIKSGALAPDEINSGIISQRLYTKDMPDPDLVIRTSGELRLSNFLVWQAAYAEIHVTPVLWPDFGKAEFVKALLDYQGRQRRFGGTGE